MYAIVYEINQYINFGPKYFLRSIGVITKSQLPLPTTPYQLVMPNAIFTDFEDVWYHFTGERITFGEIPT